MKKEAIIFIIILLLFGCGKSDGDQSLETLDIYKGTRGLTTEVVAGSLPPEIYENEYVDLVVKVTNEGPIPVSAARLLILPERGYITFEDGSPTREPEVFDLEGKEQFQNIDDLKILTFRLRGSELEPLSEVHNALISLVTCYDYSSKAYTSVCIDTDPHNIKPSKKACSAATIPLSGGQGGPLVISSIEPRMMIDDNMIRPQLKIYVENRGQGSVTRFGQVPMYCSNQPQEREDYNRIASSQIDIRMSDYTRGDFDCMPDELALKGNQDYITCTLRQGIPSDIDSYMTTLNVIINYGYVVSDARQITVNKIT